jgi:RNA-directed DNA polymerase
MPQDSQLLLKLSPETLREKFYNLKRTVDIADLLEISYEHLVYNIYLVDQEHRYRTFEILKKSGGIRQISTPITAIKIIQKKLNQVLQAVYETKPSVHGFVNGKNIVSNAQCHAKKRYVLNIDLKDFFPSINFGRVRGMFIATPYALQPKFATVLAQICCHNNHLPQGAPTSPIITNMICAKMDSQLQRLAKDCKATYTRYADDITFSTTLPQFPSELAYIFTGEDREKIMIGNQLLAIINQNGFQINEHKIRLQVKGNHQEVTGLTTNVFPNVDRKYVRQIRAMLYAWANFGLEAAETEYLNKYVFKSRSPQKQKLKFQQVLKGKIEFIGMVKGKDDSIYQKYIKQYHLLHKFSN